MELRFLAFLLGFIAFGAPATTLSAQDAGLDPLQELFGDSQLADDPLNTGEPLPPPPPRRASRPPAVVLGPVIEAIPGIRSSRQEMRLRFPEGPEGYATAELRMLFVSRAAHPGHLRFRLPLPAGSHPYALELCTEGNCRPGAQSDALDLEALAQETRTSRPPGIPREPGAAIVGLQGELGIIEAGPVVAGVPLEVRLRVLVPTRTRGGVERLRWPPMPQDDRTVPWMVQAEAPAHFELRLQGSAATQNDVWPGQTIVVEGRPRSPRPELWLSRVPCDGGRCTILRGVGGPAIPRARRLLVLIDSSPSTNGPSRGRQGQALAALLDSAPSGSSLRAYAFGTQTQAIVAEATPVEDISLPRLLEAREWDLGSTTRLDRALEVSQPQRGEEIVLLGDGEISSSPGLSALLRRLRRQRNPVHIVNLGEGPTATELQRIASGTGGILRHQNGLEESSALGQLVAPIFANALPPWTITAGGHLHRIRIRGGEELRLERSSTLGSVPSPSPEHAAHCRRLGGQAEALGPENLQSGALRCAPERADANIAVTGIRVSQAPPRLLRALRQSLRLGDRRIAVTGAIAEGSIGLPRASGTESPPAEAPSSFPEESVLQMLRRQLVPAARRCLRADRRGRLDYAISARFALVLRNQEIQAHRVDGELPDALRSCLFEAVGALDIPRFSGAVRVNYPIHTERETPPAAIELEADIAAGLEAEVQNPGDDFSLLD